MSKGGIKHKDIIFVLFSICMLSAQEAPERELVVWLRNGLLEVTEQKGGEWLGRINSEPINMVLSKYDIEAIVCPFPNYNPADTLRILPDGKSHSLVNLREICHIRLKSSNARDSLFQELSSLYEVRLIEKPMPITLHTTIPNDPLFYTQWGLRNTGQANGQVGFDIKAAEAWDLWRGSSNIIIGIVEPGMFDRMHEEFENKVVHPIGPPFNYHATAVASIAGALTNNNRGIAGVDWYAKLYAIPVNPNFPDNLYQNIVAAVDAGVHILNNSWGYPHPDAFSVLCGKAFVYAYLNDRISIASSGNTGEEERFYPAAFDEFVFAVGGVKNEGAWTEYSTYGWHIDVVAPAGENSWPNLGPEDVKACSLKHGATSYYTWFGGTSASAPHVSGVASLIKSRNPTLHNDDIYWIMRYSATDMPPSGPDKKTGYGLINALRAIKYATLPYECFYYTATGGSDIGSTDWYIMEFPYRSLEPGQSGWRVKRHYVLKNVPLPTDVYERKIWCNKTSTGWSLGSERADGRIYQWEIGWSQVLQQDQYSALLRTFVYEVQKINLLGQPYGPIEWWPTTPANVVFGYTVFGRKTITSPTSLFGISTVNGIKLTWQDNSTNELGFKIEVRGGQWSNWTLIDSVGKNVTVREVQKPFTEGTMYSFRIYAYAQEFISGYSNTVNVTMIKAPSALIIVGQPSPNQVTIQWTDNSGLEAGFKIGRMVNDEGWNQTNENYATVGPSQGVGGTVQFTDNVEFLHKYTYKVRAYDNAGHYSAWSDSIVYTSGAIAQSIYPKMSAYNNEI